MKLLRLPKNVRFIQSWPMNVTKESNVFTITKKNGFLPLQDPINKLPIEFKELESLLERMSLNLPSGEPGLLKKGIFGDTVLKELPLYKVDHINDPQLLMALFRDYTFLASAYVLEPCDIMEKTRGNQLNT